jgi:NADH-quinone oxidoreductase subunit J
MTLYGVVFYLLSAIIVMATGMAITQRHAVHAVVYLVISFFCTALVFYLLGAPFIAALEVIIYAGAIMVLFLFIIMMLRLEPPQRRLGSYLRQWMPAIILGGITLAIAFIMILANPLTRIPLRTALATPAAFGLFVFQRYWFPVEIASFVLFVALVGALYLGRRGPTSGSDQSEDRA